MEESTCFLSISGLSGVFMGLIAIAGAVIAKLIIPVSMINGKGYTESLQAHPDGGHIMMLLIAVAVIVLILALAVALLFSIRKTLKQKKKLWTSPSFRGVFLPEERNIGPEGFTADWTVTHLNRSFPRAWTGKVYSPEDESFGVNLMMEVDHYKKAERSAKYGLLFILITFFVLIIIEVRSSERIHIFYYVLVAFALILFFSLLSALSKHLGFNPAYLIASVATIGLLTAFFRSLINKKWVIIVISGLLSTLYLFIFILLALKDYAYLAGNIGLFVLLAALMMISSKYRLFSGRTADN